MQLHEIENLSAAELKDRRAELIDAAIKMPPADVAARYVQARIDSKARDEKLAEQGQTIARLNELLNAKTARIEELSKICVEADATIADVRKGNAHLRSAVQQLAAERDAETARADRLKSEATRHAEAFHAAEAALATARATLQIQAADRG